METVAIPAYVVSISAIAVAPTPVGLLIITFGTVVYPDPGFVI